MERQNEEQPPSKRRISRSGRQEKKERVSVAKVYMDPAKRELRNREPWEGMLWKRKPRRRPVWKQILQPKGLGKRAPMWRLLWEWMKNRSEVGGEGVPENTGENM